MGGKKSPDAFKLRGCGHLDEQERQTPIKGRRIQKNRGGSSKRHRGLNERWMTKKKTIVMEKLVYPTEKAFLEQQIRKREKT